MEEGASKNLRKFLLPGVIVLVIVLSGILTGYVLFSRGSPAGRTGIVSGGGKALGSPNVTTFKDTAAGVIEKGGIDGEGTHKLIREGGPSQTAYLTSSVIDLDEFVGKKVQVWGETFSGQKAGWLMDVGRVKVIE